MPLVYLDFETFYSKDYNLRKMSTREYVMDPRFEVSLCAFAIEGGPVGVARKPQLGALMRAVDWPRATVVCHNGHFDPAVLEWIFGVRPAAYIDTMAMMQALYVHDGGRADLASLARRVGAYKDREALESMKGVPYDAIDWDGPNGQRFLAYARDDVAIMRCGYHMMRGHMPDDEMRIIDLTVKMYVRGGFRLDRALLERHAATVQAERDAAVAAAGAPIGKIRSRPQFVGLLTEAGLHEAEIPRKVSVKTGGETWAFAKDDEEYLELLDHPIERVRALVAARMVVASSIEESRTALFQRLAAIGDGTLNIPLKYSGARTHRYSGVDGLNLQNLPRASALRMSLVAPPGYRVVVVDASQIEARLNAWLAGCTAICGAFARGEDVYSTFATEVYGYPIDKKSHPEERFIGKQGVLSLGYGAGARKFRWMLVKQRKPKPIEFCEQVVRTYRTTYSEIPAGWREGDKVLARMLHGGGGWWGPCRVEDRALLFPSGLRMFYPGLHYDGAQQGFFYNHPKYKTTSIWGGTMVENVCQALARIVIMDVVVSIARDFPDWFFALQVHDEVAYLVREEVAELCLSELLARLSATPAWADDTLALAAEGGTGANYGDAK